MAEMYERFTNRSRQVMQFAEDEALRLGHTGIDAGHVLLGLIKEGSGVVAHVLKNSGLNLQKLRDELIKIEAPKSETYLVKLPQTSRTKNIIERSINEARSLDHNYIGTEHLLLGLLRDSQIARLNDSYGTAAKILANLGLKPDDLRKTTLILLGALPPEPPVPNISPVVTQLAENAFLLNVSKDSIMSYLAKLLNTLEDEISIIVIGKKKT